MSENVAKLQELGRQYLSKNDRGMGGVQNAHCSGDLAYFFRLSQQLLATFTFFFFKCWSHSCLLFCPA
jgi:hypothetical protein